MPAPKKRRRRKGWLLFILILLAGSGWGASRYFKKEDTSISVQTAKVTRRDITELVVANGRIQPVTQVMISPEVAGEIMELPVKEGQTVKKGDLLVQIKADTYTANKNAAEATFRIANVGKQQAQAEKERADSEFKRSQELFKNKLITESAYIESKTQHALAQLKLENAENQISQAKFAADKSADDLAKTTIRSPLDGTITKLRSQLGERVLGTSFNMGTEMMTVAKLDEMEARVDIGEIDVVLIQVGQTARIEVDAFKDKKFKGTVTAIANATKSFSASQSMQQNSTEAPKFEVRIRVDDKEAFRPGMSVTAEVETRSRKNILTVPIQAVTTRLPVGPPPPNSKEPVKPAEVVFTIENGKAKMLPVKTGISDNEHFELETGVTEGQEIISGGYKAVSKDLDTGKEVKLGPTTDAK